MDHLETLIKQHKNIRHLLQSAQSLPSGKERSQILDQLRSEIDLHTYLEEAYVYPVLEEYDHLKRQVYGFWREHERLKQRVQSTSSVHQDEKKYQALLSQLIGVFEEHVREEEVHIFPEARRIMGAEQLEQIERNLQQGLKKGEMAA
jgi:iron-sulfur cluster repair protein YtfE (RIC family)